VGIQVAICCDVNPLLYAGHALVHLNSVTWAGALPICLEVFLETLYPNVSKEFINL